MSILLSEANRRLERLPLPVALKIDNGEYIGAADPNVILHFPNEKALMLLARNRLDAIADAVVEGKVHIEGRMRDLMAATAALVGPAGVAVQVKWWQRLFSGLRSARLHTLEERLADAEAILTKGHGPERGQQILRAYRLYLARCAMAFEEGWISLHQVLATRPDRKMETGILRGAQSVYPFRREYMYRDSRSEMQV